MKKLCMAMCLCQCALCSSVAYALQETSARPANGDAAIAELIRSSENQISTLVLAPSTPITLNRWVLPQQSTLQGQIVIFDDKEVICRKPGEPQVIRYPSQQVIAIDVFWGTEEAKQAHSLYASQQYKEAVRAAQAALKTKIFRWQQAILVREIVDSLWALGQHRSAATTFLKLVDEKPPPLLLAAIPLVWVRTELEPSAIKSAKEWLEGEDEYAKLIAASWLLSGDQREASMKVLRSLAQSSSEFIKQLATVQLWRTIPAAESLSPLLSEWSMFRDTMPIYLQVGPTMLIADKLDQSGSSLLAVPEWARIAILHADRWESAAWARKRIQQVLASQGQADEANRLNTYLSR